MQPDSEFAASPDAAAAEAGCARVANTLAVLESLLAKATPGPSRNALASVIEVMRQLQQDSNANLTRYRTLIDAVPDAVTLHDEHGHILDANAAACRVYGYPLEQLRRLGVNDLNPDLPPDHMRRLWSTFELGQTITEQMRNRHADGSLFPIEVHSNAYIDNGERRIIAVARDISERQHAERELRDSETRYAMLLRAMDKGVLVQDGEGYIISANPAACRLLGLDEAELKALRRGDLDTWSFISADGDPLGFDDLPGNRALHSGSAIDSTLLGVYIPHLHAYRWLSTSSVPQFGDDGQRPQRVISTFSDVSTLKRESEMFRTTQRLGEIGCWEIDDLRGGLYWTEHMYRIHDLPPDSPVTEARALNFFVPESRSALARALADARSRAWSFELELQLVSAIGRQRWVSVRGQPLQRHGRIYGVVGTLQNIEERKAVEERLRKQASTDPLTQLPNRDAMLALIDAAVASGGMPALLHIDLDRFKVLNDMLGHVAGDRLLVDAARRLAACAHGHASVARYGNDEFLMLIERCDDVAQAEAMATRVVEAFNTPFEHEGEHFALTVSVGIAGCVDGCNNAQTLLRHADAAMFEAKRRGRSNWQMYREHPDHGDDRRLQIESQLRLALDNDEFHLAYQPQINLEDGSVYGVEALLRWNSRQLGPQLPSAFIPYAESSGDIVRIGGWVVAEACRQMRRWLDQGVPLQRMSVNVSYRQLLSGTLLSTVEQALRENNLSGELLELEMTERVLIENVADTVETFHALKRLGVAVLIDDFGEGYSSLNYLRNLPLDGLKISHTFMHGVPAQATDAVICDAIVRIARSLGLSVVAEGVENEAQRQFLLALGAPLAQGYLFSPPLLASDIPACVARLRTDAAAPVTHD
jgi:diguanylate cyclase (GGDEF)-like protein/PAS domain S-box-containing protein